MGPWILEYIFKSTGLYRQGPCRKYFAQDSAHYGVTLDAVVLESTKNSEKEGRLKVIAVIQDRLD